MGYDNKNGRFVCHACIGDSYLKAEIRREETLHVCMICGEKQRAIAFCGLCSRVHDVIASEFLRTESEPSSWALYKELEVDWIREGENLYDILDQMLECGKSLIKAIKKELSNRYHSFDEAAAGEEDPYGDEVHYKLRELEDYRFRGTWSDFETEIRTRARFFNTEAESHLNQIFCDLNCFQSHTKPLIRKAGPNTETEVLYRARRAFNRTEIVHILEHPAHRLGAPPSRLAVSGRMNPQWISMFYGAFDPETCVAEVRPPAASFVVVGKFTIVRNLQLLDIGALQALFVKEDSFFDPEFRYLLDKARFLKRLVDIMSRPVLPSDKDYYYLPTQAVAEYLSEKMEPRIDGLVFPSSQCGRSGENVVLFQGASLVEPDGSDELEMKAKFNRHWSNEDDENFSITLCAKKKRKRVKTKKKRKQLVGYDEEWSNSGISRTRWTDLEEDLDEKPALRVNLDSLEVIRIQAVEYETKTHHVLCDLERTD